MPRSQGGRAVLPAIAVVVLVAKTVARQNTLYTNCGLGRNDSDGHAGIAAPIHASTREKIGFSRGYGAGSPPVVSGRWFTIGG
jgi:hypothetical protein